MSQHREISRVDEPAGLLDKSEYSTRNSPECTITSGAVGNWLTLSLMVVLALAGGLVLGGCGPTLTRPPVTQQDLLKLRTRGDEQSAVASRKLLGRLLERTKAEYDRCAAAGGSRRR